MKLIFSLLVCGLVLFFATPSVQAEYVPLRIHCSAWIGPVVYFSETFELTPVTGKRDVGKVVKPFWRQFLEEKYAPSADKWDAGCGWGDKAEEEAHARQAEKKVVETGWTYKGAPAIGR